MNEGSGGKLTEEEYFALLKPLSKELSAMARWVAETDQRVVILFEGRDTAGKGGSIDMFARILNPRQCRIAALPSPSERERMLDAVLKGMRWTYLGTGMTHPNFLGTVEGIKPEARAQIETMAPMFC